MNDPGYQGLIRGPHLKGLFLNTLVVMVVKTYCNSLLFFKRVFGSLLTVFQFFFCGTGRAPLEFYCVTADAQLNFQFDLTFYEPVCINKFRKGFLKDPYSDFHFCFPRSRTLLSINGFKHKHQEVGMMNAKNIRFTIIVTALVFFTASAGFSEETGTKADENLISYDKQIVLSVPEDQEARKAEVEFPHQDHIMRFGCSECHHEWDHTEMDRPEACVSCHDNFDDRKEVESYYNAFHNRDSTHSCIGCHGQMTDETAEVNPPKRCSDCHPRPERE